MNFRSFLAAVLLLWATSASAADSLTSLHPEDAYPDNTANVSRGRYMEFNKQGKQKLRERGFNAGPVNGEIDSKTQAAIAQFQLSQSLPVSGMLDEQTLSALGVQREEQASTEASAE